MATSSRFVDTYSKPGTGVQNPFPTVNSAFVPDNMDDLYDWCKYIWNYFGPYRRAMRRIISYFITKIQFDGELADDEKRKYEDYLDDPLDAIASVKQMLYDRAAVFGRGHISVRQRFDRWLVCSCGYGAPLARFFKNPRCAFSFRIPDFVATCPVCRQRSAMKVEDRLRDDGVYIKHWAPEQIHVLVDPDSGDRRYFWRIPNEYKRKIRSGRFLFLLERADMDVINAISAGMDLAFDKDAILTIEERTITLSESNGVALPPMLWVFRQILYAQTLQKGNENLAADFLTPWRVLSPEPSSGKAGGAGGLGATDPILGGYSGGDFKSFVNQMVEDRRRDPLSVHTSPYPIRYQVFGAEATQMAPVEMLDQAYGQLDNDLDVPVELSNATLQVQAVPTALRLFASTHSDIVHDANKAIRWIGNRTAAIRGWTPATLSFQAVTIADDMDRQTMALQLFMSGQMPGAELFDRTGMGDWRQMQRRRSKENQFLAELAKEEQEAADKAGLGAQIAAGLNPLAPPGTPMGMDPGQAGQPGQMPAGGQPQPGQAGAGSAPNPAGQPGASPVDTYLASRGSSPNRSVDDVMTDAQNLANQLLNGTPETVKDSDLRKLKDADPAVHSLVKELMGQMREDTKRQANNAVAMGGQ